MTDVIAADPADVTAAYEKKGYAIVRGVIDADLIAEAQAHLDWLQERYPDVRPELLNHQLLVQDPFAMRLSSDPRLIDVIEPFLGPNIALFAAHYICKPPKDGQQVLWHQDASYWPLEPMDVISIWLAVDDSDVENGCLRVIPGTHRNEVAETRKRPDVVSVLNSEMVGEVDEDAAVDLVMKAGDIEIHHPNIVHGSNANRSDRRRAGLTLRYIPTTTRVTVDNIPPLLVRGEAVPGINNYAPRPNWVEGEHFRFSGCETWATGPS